MQDPPTPPELLAAVARFLRDDPQLRFDYASNVTGVDWLDTVLKEKVKVKKVVDGSLEDLNALLCEAIETRRVTLQTPGLADHLWSTTLAKLAVDQPTYAAYVAAIRDTAITGAVD